MDTKQKLLTDIVRFQLYGGEKPQAAPEDAADLRKRFFRIRHDMQRVRNEDDVKAPLRVRQRGRVLHHVMQGGGTAAFFGPRDHFR